MHGNSNIQKKRISPTKNIQNTVGIKYWKRIALLTLAKLDLDKTH